MNLFEIFAPARESRSNRDNYSGRRQAKRGKTLLENLDAFFFPPFAETQKHDNE